MTAMTPFNTTMMSIDKYVQDVEAEASKFAETGKETYNSNVVMNGSDGSVCIIGGGSVMSMTVGDNGVHINGKLINQSHVTLPNKNIQAVAIDSGSMVNKNIQAVAIGSGSLVIGSGDFLSGLLAGIDNGSVLPKCASVSVTLQPSLKIGKKRTSVDNDDDDNERHCRKKIKCANQEDEEGALVKYARTSATSPLYYSSTVMGMAELTKLCYNTCTIITGYLYTIYFIGGWGNEDMGFPVESYDGEAWQLLAPLLHSRWRSWPFLDHTHSLIVVGGDSDNRKGHLPVEKYDAWKNVWSDVSVSYTALENQLRDYTPLIHTIPGRLYAFPKDEFVWSYDTFTTAIVKYNKIGIASHLARRGTPLVYDKTRNIIWVLALSNIYVFSCETNNWISEKKIIIPFFVDLSRYNYLCLVSDQYLVLVNKDIHWFDLVKHVWSITYFDTDKTKHMLGMTSLPGENIIAYWDCDDNGKNSLLTYCVPNQSSSTSILPHRPKTFLDRSFASIITI